MKIIATGKNATHYFNLRMSKKLAIIETFDAKNNLTTVETFSNKQRAVRFFAARVSKILFAESEKTRKKLLD